LAVLVVSLAMSRRTVSGGLGGPTSARDRCVWEGRNGANKAIAPYKTREARDEQEIKNETLSAAGLITALLTAGAYGQQVRRALAR